jgi:hypothetical protein
MEALRLVVFPGHSTRWTGGDYTVSTRELKDCRGTPIVVGSKVAYNQSGNVVPGEVLKINGSWRQETWGLVWDGSFKIKNLLHPQDKASKVKRPESMMVLPKVYIKVP